MSSRSRKSLASAAAGLLHATAKSQVDSATWSGTWEIK